MLEGLGFDRVISRGGDTRKVVGDWGGGGGGGGAAWLSTFLRENNRGGVIGIYLFSILPSLAVMSRGQSDEDEEDELQNKTETET